MSSPVSSEADLKAHIASYPELYEDLAVDVLEERLEMWCVCDSLECICDEFECICDEFECICDDLCIDCWTDFCVIDLCDIDS